MCLVSNVPLCLCIVSEGRKEARDSFSENLRLRIFNELMLFLACVWKVSLFCSDVPSKSQTHQHRFCFFSRQSIGACVYKHMKTNNSTATEEIVVTNESVIIGIPSIANTSRRITVQWERVVLFFTHKRRIDLPVLNKNKKAKERSLVKRR